MRLGASDFLRKVHKNVRFYWADNAQLIDLLTWAWQDNRNPLYEARVRETVDWLLREMIAREDDTTEALCGAFAASLGRARSAPRTAQTR